MDHGSSNVSLSHIELPPANHLCSPPPADTEFSYPSLGPRIVYRADVRHSLPIHVTTSTSQFPSTHNLTPYAQLVLYAWKLGRPSPTVGPSPQFPTPRSYSTHPLRLGVVASVSWRSIPKPGPNTVVLVAGERLLGAPPLSRSRGGGSVPPPLSWRGGLGPRNSPLPLSSSSSSGASSSAETASDVSSSSPAATITGDDVVL